MKLFTVLLVMYRIFKKPEPAPRNVTVREHDYYDEPRHVARHYDSDPYGEDYGCNSIFGMG